MLQFPFIEVSRVPVSLSGVCMAVARIVCIIFIPFRLSEISHFILQQPQMLHLFPTWLSWGGIWPLLQFPNLPYADPVLLTLFFFCPPPFLLQSFSWFCIFFFQWSGTPALCQLLFCRIFLTVFKHGCSLARHLELWKRISKLGHLYFSKKFQNNSVMHLDFKKWLQVFLLNGSFSDIEFYYYLLINNNTIVLNK